MNQPSFLRWRTLTWAAAIITLHSSVQAQSFAELSLEALSGKSLTCTITGGNSPFESAGTFVVTIDAPAAGSYAIESASGSVDAHTGTYLFIQGSEQAYFKLDNYFGDGRSAEIEFFAANESTATALVGANKGYFEIFAAGVPANKHGTFVIGAGSGPTGGGGTTGGGGGGTVGGGGGGGTGGGSSGGGSGAAGGYFSNFSVRARTSAGDGTLILGMVIDGTATTEKSLLVRAAGPALAGYQVAGYLADPILGIFGSSGLIDSNDNWDSANADLLATIARLGAFGFTAGSKDAILTGSAHPGAYTIHVSGGAGIALAEIYDGEGALTTGSARLVNASARATVGGGDDVFIAGFVVGGTAAHKVVIRAAGPALDGFGVSGTLSNPRIDVHQGATIVASNDDWDAATLADQNAVGAFAFATGSKDAVVVAELAPGVYSVVVSGVAGATGVAMIELYEAP